MSELRVQKLKLPAAGLGQQNPLPAFFPERHPLQVEMPADLSTEVLGDASYAHVTNILPYSLQDGYTRNLQISEFSVAILENEILRAVFLLELGGRLWSLVHKPTGRELLACNSAIQFANLAIRNAWFAGGVEWNVGTIGHSPFTCSPLFTSRLERPDGTPVLRLYEWERFRQTPFQIDAFLPDGSPVLFLHTTITNPNNHPVPIYWWSNVAVPERPGTRVLVPTDSAYCLGFEPGKLLRIPLPCHAGIDLTYAVNVSHASDFFFDIPTGRRLWITALDADGYGLVQTSTGEMAGRKLWTWGTNPGGRNWQRLLSPKGEKYLEIQAGLTRTQLEHKRMPARARWSWTEAYGLLNTNPGKVHGEEWDEALREVERKLEHLIPSSVLDAESQGGTGLIDSPPIAVIRRGSGWGALERHRREASGEVSLDLPGTPFDDLSLGEEQSPWIQLLEDGSFPRRDPGLAPQGFIVDVSWRNKLEESLEQNDGDNWLAWFHLGLMHRQAGDLDKARAAWERSISQENNPWAIRNLGILAWEAGQLKEAIDLISSALRMRPDLLPLVTECGRLLLEAGRSREWLDLLPELPQSVRASGRVRLLEAQAALALNEFELVKRFFSEGIVVEDLREGETVLSDLWYAYQERLNQDGQSIVIKRSKDSRTDSIPEALDFRLGR